MALTEEPWCGGHDTTSRRGVGLIRHVLNTRELLNMDKENGRFVKNSDVVVDLRLPRLADAAMAGCDDSSPLSFFLSEQFLFS